MSHGLGVILPRSDDSGFATFNDGDATIPEQGFPPVGGVPRAADRESLMADDVVDNLRCSTCSRRVALGAASALPSVACGECGVPVVLENDAGQPVAQPTSAVTEPSAASAASLEVAPVASVAAEQAESSAAPVALRPTVLEEPDPDLDLVPIMLDRSNSRRRLPPMPTAAAAAPRVPVDGSKANYPVPGVVATPVEPAAPVPATVVVPSVPAPVAVMSPAPVESPATPPVQVSATGRIILTPDSPLLRLGNEAPAPVAPAIASPAPAPTGPLPVPGPPPPANTAPMVPTAAPAPIVQSPVVPSPVVAAPLPPGPSREDALAVLTARATGEVHVVESGRRAHPIWWTLLGVMGSAAAVLFILLATGQVKWFDATDAALQQQVVGLKSEAESLATQGRLAESHERYRKIDQLVAGQTSRTAELDQLVDAAREDGRRVYKALLARQEAEAASRAAQAARQTANAPTPVVPVPVVPAPAVAPRPEAPRVEPPRVKPAQVEVPRPNPAEVDPDRIGEPFARPEPPRPAVAAPQPEPVRPAAMARRDRPLPRPIRDDIGTLTDERIGKSIQMGVEYLLSQYNPRTRTLLARQRQGGDNSYTAGMNALSAYALLQAGQAIDDPRLNPLNEQMRALIDAMKSLPIDGHHGTYARALRSTCLALYNRPDDFKTMAADADWLIGTTDGGAYTYTGAFQPIGRRTFGAREGSWDNSNSQYGLLGVWSAADADPRVEVPLAYWRAVVKHWTDCQGADGRWGYTGGDNGRLTMTCAGLASLFVAHEYLEPPLTSGQVGREPFPPALKRGLDWFERGNNSVIIPGGGWWGYALYGIERVGLASGFKHFGEHDWYRELALQVIRRQDADGSWGDGVVDTAYAVLFLSRGRHPVMMSKLRFDGYWSNRPRDLANLARFAGRQIERPLNWQVVNVDNPWTDWIDSAVLYIASHDAPKITDDQIDKLRKYVEAGGMIFTHADTSAPKFDTWARSLAGRLFPKYPLAPIPDQHPIWSVVYRPSPRPNLMGVSNGSRLLMVHCPTDIALRWQHRVDRPYESKNEAPKPNAAPVVNPDVANRNATLYPFHVGVNIFFYAAGKRDFRNRIDSAWITPAREPAIETVRIARLEHGNNWDPEPAAWVRYSNWFHRQTSYRLQTQSVRMADLQETDVQRWPMAHLTGTTNGTFTAEEAAGLRRYVAGGGVVLVEPTGGLNGFDVAVRSQLLPKAFPTDIPELVDPATHPLFQPTTVGMEDCGKSRSRLYTVEKLGGGNATIQILRPGSSVGKPTGGCVVITSLDLTSGILGANTWGITGFHPRYAEALVKNLVFWSIDGMPGLRKP